MPEPIILDGGAQMVTIHLPASYGQTAQAGTKFVVAPEPNTEPFQRIVVTDNETKHEVLNWPINTKQWTIEIK